MKGLDWPNESWVRVYRRDTAGWQLLGMAGQAVYLALQRKLDRAGVLPLDGELRHEAVAAVLGWDAGFVERGLDRLAEKGFLLHDRENDCLLDPDFIERDEAPASDAQRQRESRARRRERSMSRNVTEPSRPVTASHVGPGEVGGRVDSTGGTEAEDPGDTSKPVTKSDGAVTNGDQTVTRCHSVSHAVTPSRTEPNRTEPIGRGASPPTTSATQPSMSTRGEPTTTPQGEITWRIEQSWAMHLEARARFYARKNGDRPSRNPTLTREVREAIREQLHRHDAHLLAADRREQWVRDSAVRAAGIGLFLDGWCTGQARDNRIGEDEGAKLYIEPWRPWKRLHRKPDPVPRYAELYWERKDVQEAEQGRLQAADTAARRALQDAGGADLFRGLAPSPDDD